MILRPGAEQTASDIFAKWNLDFAVIGKTTDTGRMVIRHNGEIEADIPVTTLANSAPQYERPWTPPQPAKPILPEWVRAPESGFLNATKTLMESPDLCSRRWIWEQYDHMVMGDTIGRPGGDAAVIRIHATNKAIAATCDVSPRYVAADPEMGTKQAVAEAWRNLTAVGAEPLAITDNMNFANPERPEIMGQFVASVRGMANACKTLDFPVVSGNVSLYNETNGIAIPPTPAIGAVGLISDLARRADLALKKPGQLLILIGREQGWLGQTIYQKIITGALQGAPPPVDLSDEIKAGSLVRNMIKEGLTNTAHDISDGGLLVALAEMALAGAIGIELFPYEGRLPPHAVWFGEDQGRYIVAADPSDAEPITERARLLALPARIIGRVGGNALKLRGEPDLPLADLRSAHEAWLPNYMSATIS